MKKIAILILSILFAGLFVACNQDITVDAQTYANMEVDTFVLNGQNYATLQEAVNAKLGKGVKSSKAAGDNDGIIYLMKNTSGPGAVIDQHIAGGVIIDFNNYTYSFTNVTGLQGGDNPKAETFGLGITNGADVTLRGLQQIDLFDTTTTDLTMVYVAGQNTKLTIEDAPKMKVEDDQYVFWAADGATLTIGSTTTTSEKTEITGKIAATGTSTNKPVVSFNNDTKINASELKADSAVVVINTSEASTIDSFVGANEANIVVSGTGNVTVNKNDSSDGTYEIENTSSSSETKVEVPTKDGSTTREITPGEKVEGDAAPKEDTTPSVAMIGSTLYKTLEAAVTASNSGDTIILLKNIDLTSYARGAAHEFALSGRTLDLNSKTISVRNQGVVYTGTGFTIKNGTITAVPSNVVTEETINDSYALFIGWKNEAKDVVLENLVLNGGLNVSHGSTVTVQGEKTKINGTKYYAVWAQGKSVVTLKNGIYSLATEGVVKTASLPDPDPVLSVGKGETVDVDKTNCGTIVVEGGIFTVPSSIPGKDSPRSSKLAGIGEGGAAKTNIAIKGGTYNVDPSTNVADGYEAKNNGDGTWTVVEKEPVAAIGDTKYFSLNDAFAASIEGDEVVLLVDTSVDTYIPINHSVSLNLNGKTVTNNVSNNRLFRLYNSTFEIKGNNGSVIIPSTNIGSFGFVDLRGTNNDAKGNEVLIIENATFTGATAAGSFFAFREDGQTIKLTNVNCTATAPKDPVKYLDKWYVGSNFSIVNGAGVDVNLTVTGGKYNYTTYNDKESGYKAQELAVYAFQAGKSKSESKSVTKMTNVKVESNTGVLECHGKVEYENCTFIVNGTGLSYDDSAVCAAWGATVDVYNTSYSGKYGVYVYDTGGTINIHGGTFKGTANAVIADAKTNAVSKVNIYGGVFSGNLLEHSTGGSAEIIIKGGTFDHDPSAYVADGYVAVKDTPETGWWTVKSIADVYGYLFGGGKGTEEEPFLIYDYETMQHVSQLYDVGYCYYAVDIARTDNEKINCTGWVPVYLNGSFDGNGVSFTDVTACLFMNVGYKLRNENIVLKDFDATMNVSSNGLYGAAALIKNIFNSGKTTFNNVNVHGYLEGYWNMGSFYNYGTANYDSVGSNYEVEFNNCNSDATLVCVSGNTIGGLFGHSYEGAGHSFVLRVNNSSYAGHMYLTTSSGEGNKYFGMTSDSSNVNNHFIIDEVEMTGNQPPYTNSTKISQIVATKDTDAYKVAKQENATKIVATITAQLTAYENNVKIPNLSGITMVLSNNTITNPASSQDVLGLFSSVSISNNQETYDASIVDGVLQVKLATDSNYLSGNIRLQINQYDANGMIVSAGTLDIASRENATSDWVVK